MTSKREVSFNPDALGWVHSELAEIKSKLALAEQAAEQGRSVATDAAEKARQAESTAQSLAGQPTALAHLQDGLAALREQLVRAQEDIHSLRQSREEMERHDLAEADRVRQERNDVSHRFGEVERMIEAWQERLIGAEEHNRRNLESAAQLAMRLEAMAGGLTDADSLQARIQAQVSRVDQELSRLSGGIAGLQREDDVQRERTEGAFEMLRRLETEIEAAKDLTLRLSRIDDRLELVQAERTRHNERLNDISTQLAEIERRLNEHDERETLIETRMTSFLDGLRGLEEKLLTDREQIAAYLSGLAELEADFRKRETAALDKEARELRSRALRFAEE